MIIEQLYFSFNTDNNTSEFNKTVVLQNDRVF